MRRVLTVVILLAVVLAVMQSAAQQQAATTSAQNPLVRVLVSKGLLTEAEATEITQGGGGKDADQRLTKILLSKGLITQQDLEQVAGPKTEPVAAPSTASARVIPAVITTVTPAQASQTAPATQTTPTAKPPAAPGVVPAIAPLRVLPIVVPKREGLIPDLKLGSGARLRPYGFIKASAIYDTASSGGPTFGSNDFPLPLLLGDTGPDTDPQFHLKARFARFGSDFEWVDPVPNVTITGKLEADFEGSYTNSNNRNISSVRSSQLSLRLAWMRLDTKLGQTPWFVQFGQDWTLLGSSTLMDLFETTGLGLGLGGFYERAPMMRTGLQFGKGDFKFQPEFAVVLPIYGEPSLDVDQRTRFGARAGSDSAKPELQSRLVFQFPLSKAAGVAPAQIIVSGGHSSRAEIVPRGNLPTTPVAALGGRSIQSFFPQGFKLESDRNAWSAEVQLPTSAFTLIGKYYRGGDLRFYFGGLLNDIFFNTQGTTPIATVPSFTNRAVPVLAIGGVAVPAAMEPVRGTGGLVQIGLPLSRWFHANPEGRNGGWSFYLSYSTDNALARDTIRNGANGLTKSNYAVSSLRYKLNRWMSFVNEASYWDTRAASQITTPKLFRGLPAHTAHTWRNEFGTIISF